VVPSTLATCNAGTWLGNPTVTVQWNRNGVSIPGATARTYVLGDADIHATITCTEIARNSAGEAAEDSNNQLFVLDPAPVALSPPTPAFYAAGERICRAGTFSYLGSTSLTGTSVQFTFLRNGSYIGGGNASAEGFNGNIHSLVTADLGQRLSCIETVANGDGLSASATSGQLVIPDDPACGLAASVHLSEQFAFPPVARVAGNTGGVVISLPVQPVCPPPESTDGELEVSPAPPVSNPPTVTEQVNHGSLIVAMGCPGTSSTCSDTLVLQSGKLPAPKAASAAARHLTLARATVRIGPGTHRRIKLTLNATGRRLLRHQHEVTTTLLAVARAKTTIVAHIRLRR